MNYFAVFRTNRNQLFFCRTQEQFNRAIRLNWYWLEGQSEEE